MKDSRSAEGSEADELRAVDDPGMTEEGGGDLMLRRVLPWSVSFSL